MKSQIRSGFNIHLLHPLAPFLLLSSKHHIALPDPDEANQQVMRRKLEHASDAKTNILYIKTQEQAVHTIQV